MSRPVVPTEDTFAVATYNVHRWVGVDGRQSPERTVRVIRELDADIVGLQEVTLLQGDELGTTFGHLAPSPYGEPHHTDAVLAEATGMEVIPGPTMFHAGRTFGNVLLTRHPVRNVCRHDLSYLTREPRGVLDVELEVENSAVRVLVTHFGLSPAERTVQTNSLLEVLKNGKTEPIVLMGDFNQWFPYWGSLRPLHRWFEGSPYHRTFPSRFPLFPLDRIWVQPYRRLARIGPHRSRLARIASDHLPVRAVVRKE